MVEKQSDWIFLPLAGLTSSEVDDDVAKKNGVRDHVEDDPACSRDRHKWWKVWGDEPAGGEVIVEEGDGDGEDDEVGNEEQEHADVPIKS